MYRVVLADDSEEFRRWLLSLLDESGEFKVVGEARNGTEAIDVTASLIPDLLIADLHMPDIDGLDVARSVQERSPTVRVILVSTDGQPVYERLAKQEGALAFIPKARLHLETLRAALKGAE